MKDILIAFGIFAALGLGLGLLLALAAKLFAVKTDERVEQIAEILPGANCGGCGFAGCHALAEAIVKGEAKPNACVASGAEKVARIASIMGVEAEQGVRMRAQVMCSGTTEFAKKKYIYEGLRDCAAASRLAGGDKLCPNGCVGLGTCVQTCAFHAITVIDGVAVVDYDLCKGCGMCVQACPKHLIELIPYDSKHWVGCKSCDNGKITRSYCDVGCISCRLCEKSCPTGAITVDENVAHIDYEKCIGCDACVDKCPRKIIWSSEVQDDGLVISRAKINLNV